MSDNTQRNSTSGGDTIRDIDRGSAKTQVVQLDAGGASAESLVTLANPLPVQITDGGGQPSVQVDASGNLQTRDAAVANAQTADQPLRAVLVGDETGDFAGVNLLEELMNTSSGLAANVNLVSGIKIDPSQAIVLSDAIVYPIRLGAANQLSGPIDCTGYASGTLSLTTGTCNLFGSVDGKNAFSFSAVSLANNAISGGSFGNSILWNFPVNFKYLSIQSVGAAAYGTLVLKQGPFISPQPTVNLAQISSNAITPLISGTMPVIGNTTVNSGANIAPVLIGASDPGVLLRRVLSDTSGRVIVAGQTVPGATASLSTAPLGAAPAPQSNQNLAAVQVQDRTQVDGQEDGEMLSQILMELRIANEQRREMMLMIASLQSSNTPQVADDPAAYRADPTYFN